MGGDGEEAGRPAATKPCHTSFHISPQASRPLQSTHPPKPSIAARLPKTSTADLYCSSTQLEQVTHLLVPRRPVGHPVQLILQAPRLLQLVKGREVAAAGLQVLTQPELERLQAWVAGSGGRSGVGGS